MRRRQIFATFLIVYINRLSAIINMLFVRDLFKIPGKIYTFFPRLPIFIVLGLLDVGIRLGSPNHDDFLFVWLLLHSVVEHLGRVLVDLFFLDNIIQNELVPSIFLGLKSFSLPALLVHLVSFFCTSLPQVLEDLTQICDVFVIGVQLNFLSVLVRKNVMVVIRVLLLAYRTGSVFGVGSWENLNNKKITIWLYFSWLYLINLLWSSISLWRFLATVFLSRPKTKAEV